MTTRLCWEQSPAHRVPSHAWVLWHCSKPRQGGCSQLHSMSHHPEAMLRPSPAPVALTKTDEARGTRKEPMKSQVHPWEICVSQLSVSLPLLLGHSFLFIPSSKSTVAQHWDHSALLLLTIISSRAEAGCNAKWQGLSSQAGGRALQDCLLPLFHSLHLSQHWSFLGNLRQLQPKRDCWQWGIFKPGPKPIYSSSSCHA